MKNITRAHLALLGTNLFFAINFTAIKYLVNAGFILPFGLNLVRAGISTILLWLLFIVKPTKVSIRKKDIGRFLLCALLGIAFNQLLFVKGLSLTYSIHAALLMLTTPIIIALLAYWMLREKMTAAKLIGLLLGVAGAVILITGREQGGGATDVLLGDVLVILNAVAYAFYFILVKPLMKTYNAIGIIRILFTIGFFMMLPFCWEEYRQINFSSYTPVAWLCLLCISVCGTFLAYVFNIYGIKVLGAATAGAYIYLQIVFSSVIAVIFLHEQVNAIKLIAAGCIVLGVYLSNYNKKNAQL